MKRKSLLITISIALIAGCNSTSGLPTDVVTQAPTIAHITPTITGTFAPVLTETTTTSIPAEFASNNLVQSCLEIEDQEMPISEIARYGTVVVGGGLDESPYLLNLETGERNNLPFDSKNEVALSELHSSPDGNMLAYVEGIQDASNHIVKQKIWVVDANGKVLASQMINPEILNANWQWLDNERLQFNFKSITPKDGSVAVYSPFTNEWQYVSNKLPNFYEFHELDPSWWLVNYNSNLEWVIYLCQVEEFVTGPILWDVKSQKVIWQFADPNAIIKMPNWSPSHSEIAVIVDGHLHLINRNGEASLTPGLGDDSEIMRFTWSPDGNYIALLVRYYQPQLKGYLMLYDIRRNQIIDYCIESDNLFGVFPPVWSLNSQLISFRIMTMQEDAWGTSIILDIQDNAVYKVPESMQPLAWMNSIP